MVARFSQPPAPLGALLYLTQCGGGGSQCATPWARFAGRGIMSAYLDSTASMCAGSVSSTRFDSRGRALSSCFCVDGVGIAPAMMGTSLGLAVGFARCEEGMAQAATTMNGSRNDVVQTICWQIDGCHVWRTWSRRHTTARGAAENWLRPLSRARPLAFSSVSALCTL